MASLADVSNASWTPTSDSARIPEVRHNLRLITEAATADLQGLAREGAEIQKRRKTIQAEDVRLRKRVTDEAERKYFTCFFKLICSSILRSVIARMQKVHLVCDDIQSMAKSLASSYEATLDPLSPHISQLVTTYPHEYDRYRLDEVVVAAIAPIVSLLYVRVICYSCTP